MNEVQLMQWMSVDQLAVYSDVLTQVERADADLARWMDDIHPLVEENPDAPLPEDLRRTYIEISGRWESAHQAQNDLRRTVLTRLKSQLRGWETLLPWTLQVIRALADRGISPCAVGGRKEFLKCVYAELVHEHGTQLANFPEFKYVRIVEFLSGPFCNRCPRLAEECRRRGEFYLATLLDELNPR